LDASEFIEIPEKDHLPAPDVLMNLFRKRRSTRIYKNTPVEKEKLEQIIQAGRFAPTGGNLQATRYTVVHTPDKLNPFRSLVIKTLGQMARDMEATMAKAPNDQQALFTQNRMFAYFDMFKKAEEEYQNGIDRILWHAPALILIHVSKRVENPGVDVGLAGMQMALMAEALGLGSCFIGLIVNAVNHSNDLKEMLMIPKDHQIVTSMVMGYPDVSYVRLVSRNRAKARYL
jgi:nitroreductase